MAGRVLRFLREVLPLLVIFVGRASLADHYWVPSGSMEPTLHVGDHLLVDKRAYGLRLPLTQHWVTRREPSRGDIVLFVSPVDERTWVKRVVGLPGDVLSFDGHRLTVNGEVVKQSQVGPDLWEQLGEMAHPLTPGQWQGPTQQRIRIPPGQYFVMGDHRGNSADSRFFGLVPHERLLGRGVWILYSPRPVSLLERWGIPLTRPDFRQPVTDAQL